uniref:Uncharacterized protein n=1 Tax=Arundo donax TaxID=35708 RepID=A0A0A9FSH8_ARUDO
MESTQPLCFCENLPKV